MLLRSNFSPLSTIFCYMILDFDVKTGIRFSLRDKRLFEITEVEITRVDCISSLLPLLQCLLKLRQVYVNSYVVLCNHTKNAFVIERKVCKCTCLSIRTNQVPEVDCGAITYVKKNL